MRTTVPFRGSAADPLPTRPSRNTHVLVVFVALAFAAALEPPAAADGDPLVLEAEASAARLASGDALVLEATFRNTGTAPLEAWLPEHIGAVPFPSWTFVGENGERYVPHTPSFQSMWTTGLQGEIMRLAPGATRRFATRVTEVVREREPQHDVPAQPIDLPPGRYTVRCVYEKENARVPHGGTGMRMRRTWKPYEGLWTGRLVSAPLTLVVAPSDEPTLSVEAPASVAFGDPYPVRLVLENPGAERAEITGAFVVTVSKNARAAGTARFVYRNGTFLPTGAGGVHTMRLAPGARIAGTLDLTLQSFATGRDGEAEAEFYGVAAGLFHLGVRVTDARGEVVAAAGMFRRVKPLAERPDAGLRLRLEPIPSATASPSTVTVVLENAGEHPVTVPASLAYPRHVFFSLVREGATRGDLAYRTTGHADTGPLGHRDEPGMHAKISKGLAWRRDAFETGGAETFVVLAPGSALRRRVRVGELVAPHLDEVHGRFALRVHYRNRTTGRRQSLDNVFVGRIESAPVTISGGAW